MVWWLIHLPIPGLGKRHMLQGSSAHAPHLLKPSSPRDCALQQETPPQWEAVSAEKRNPHVLQLEKAPVQQPRPNTARNNKFILKIKVTLSVIKWNDIGLTHLSLTISSSHPCSKNVRGDQGWWSAGTHTPVGEVFESSRSGYLC